MAPVMRCNASLNFSRRINDVLDIIDPTLVAIFHILHSCRTLYDYSV